MIVVTTPTGNIGSKILAPLLAAGESVRVIARDPSKLAPAVAGKVDVVQGSSDDPVVLDRALRGAESLFWLVPPAFQTPDVRAYYLGFTRRAAEAIRAHGVKRVVSVSSLGRHLGRRAGVASIAHEMEDLLERTGAAHRGLWNPGFMENMLMQLPPLKAQGTFFAPSKPDLKLPHAATRDIAARGAKLLLDRSWSGSGGVAVLGPEDLSPNDQAAIMTEVLGRPIRFQPIPGAAYQESLMSHGASASIADALVELYAAVDEGLYGDHGPRSAEDKASMTFRQWCEQTLKPAFQS